MVNVRRKRCKNGKQKQTKTEEHKESMTNEEQKAGGMEEKALVFRNYLPSDPSLKKYRLPRPEVVDISKSVPEVDLKEVTELLITPKKANWDLKRDIQSKLDKLENKTQRAILELLS